MYCFY